MDLIEYHSFVVHHNNKLSSFKCILINRSLSSLGIKDPCPIAKLDDEYTSNDSNHYLMQKCIH